MDKQSIQLKYTETPIHALATTAFISCGLITAFFCFLPATSGPFIFDDYPNLEKLGILSGNITKESILEYLSSGVGAIGRPLSMLSFLIEDTAWPTDPQAFKRNNILFHLLTACLLFALSRKLLHSTFENQAQALVASIAVFLLWLLHPLHVSTIMLVVQRMTILSNLFIILGLLAYTYFLLHTRIGALKRSLLASSSLGVAAVLAFAAKETGLLIFAYASILNLTLMRTQVGKLPHLPRRIIHASTFLPTLIIIALLIWQVRDPVTAYWNRDFTLLERLLSQARLIWIYLFEIVIPDVNVSVYHDDFQKSKGILQPITTLPAVAGVFASLILFVVVRKRFPLIAFCIGWYLAGHLIESTVIPLELRFDHRNYLAMFGPLLGLVIGAQRALKERPKIFSLLITAAISVSAAVTTVASDTWGDERLLAEMLYIEQPQSLRAAQQLTSFYARDRNPPGALAVIRQSKERMPDRDVFHFMQTLIECSFYFDSVDSFDGLIELAKDAEYERYVLDIVTQFRLQIGTGCDGKLTEARFVKLIRNLIDNPNYNRRTRTLAFLYAQLAKIEIRRGNPSKAYEHLDKVNSISGTFEDLISQANVAVSHGDFCLALEIVERSRSVDRKFSDDVFFPRLIPISRVLEHIPPDKRRHCPSIRTE